MQLEIIQKILGVKGQCFFFISLDIILTIDLYYDYMNDAPFYHLVVDQTLVFFSTMALGAILPKLIKKIETMSYEMDLIQKKLTSSNNEKQIFREGISRYIQQKLILWELTTGEKDIFVLLVKGLSFVEIADIRKTQEQTVRQQALSIYRKTGLKGRKELAAYFLEDFFDLEFLRKEESN